MSSQHKPLLPSSEIPDEPVLELHEKPQTGSALTRALGATAGAASGYNAAKQAIHESMGIGGILKPIANVTAVAFVCFMFYFIVKDWTATQKAALENERVERQRDREEMAKTRDGYNAEMRALTAEIRADRESQRAVLESQRQMLSEQRSMIAELRGLTNALKTTIGKEKE